MLEPSLAFYAALFGAMKPGAVAVPLFTLFGPDGVRLRVDDCTPKLLVDECGEAPSLAELGSRWSSPTTLLMTRRSAPLRGRHAADDWRCSSTPRARRANCPRPSSTPIAPSSCDGRGALRHGHPARRPVLLPVVAGLGPRLWHGTLAPLALGVTIGAYAGKFDADAAAAALQDYRFTNISAAATHYRMMKQLRRGVEATAMPREDDLHRRADRQRDRAFVEATFGRPVCSMYGTTEIGVILVSYPGAEDFVVKPGSLGKPIPGVQRRGAGRGRKPARPA